MTEKNKPDTKKYRTDFIRAANISSAGFSLVISTILGGGLGWVLDKYFHTSPVLSIIFFVLGIISGFYSMYRIVRNNIE